MQLDEKHLPDNLKNIRFAFNGNDISGYNPRHDLIPLLVQHFRNLASKNGNELLPFYSQLLEENKIFPIEESYII